MRSAIPLALYVTALLFAASSALPQSKASNVKEVSFVTEDGVKIYADVYESAKGKKASLILLFHQGGGDARGEYGSYIAPRLVKAGYNVIAVDQRTGGDWFKGTNRTVAGLNGKEFGFCDAYPDLKAALQFARKNRFKGKRFAWGSSYSATLALRLASEFPKDLAGVLAFSPAGGPPMHGCQPADYAPAVKLPVLVLRPASEMEREISRQQFQLFEKHKFHTYTASNGVHGSSMLNPERVTGDVEEHWKRVLGFLRQETSGTARSFVEEIEIERDYSSEMFQIARWIRSTVVETPLGTVWPDDALSLNEVSPNLITGVAGKVLFFLEVNYASKDNPYLKDVRLGSDYLLKVLPETFKNQSPPSSSNGFVGVNSLYGDVAGTGFALSEAYKATGDKRYLNGALECVDRMIKLARGDDGGVAWNDYNDIWNGNAGSGLFLLYAAREMKHAGAKETAVLAGRKLLSRAVKEKGGSRWKLSEQRNLNLPNFSHGTAGVGYFLATLYQDTKHKEFLDAAVAAGGYLQSIAKIEEGGFLVPYSVPNGGFAHRFDVGWAHGGAGTARLFFRLWQITKDPKWLDLVESSALGIKQSGLPGKLNVAYTEGTFGLDMRFGSAGVADFFLNLYRINKNKEHLNYADLLITDILSRASPNSTGLKWIDKRAVFMERANTPAAFTGYLYGGSGYGILLLRASAIAQGKNWKIRFPDEPF